MNFFAAAATAFILIVPVELPDKTFIATLILATKYRHWPVWIGAISAFFVQCLVAVAAGQLVTLLPHALVQWVVAGLFAVGAVILFRSARRKRALEMSDEPPAPVAHPTGVRAAAASFVVLFAAEWGDLSQLLTAGLVARGGNPFGVFLGSWLGLAAVSGAAVLLGRVLLTRVRPSIVSYLASGVCTALALVTAVAAA
jgi:putative Ca2+/H+ antiporter (TMEM165/GDT1 family)